MPSGLTHVLLTDHFAATVDHEDLKILLNSKIVPFRVGSLGPDLPYASIIDHDLFLTNDRDTADFCHYNKTNQIPIRVIRELKKLKPNITSDEFDTHLAFFLGYISHVIIDGIFHPFVQDKVGEYNTHSYEHTQNEFCTDMLLYDYFKNKSTHKTNLKDSQIEHLFDEYARENEYVNKTAEILAANIKKVYKKKYSAYEIKWWMIGIYRMFNISTNGLPSLVKKLAPKTKNFEHPNLAEIDKDKYLILEKRFGDEGPNFLKKDKISYIDDGIPHFIKVTSKIFKKIYAYLENNGPAINQNDIPEINLDTGRLTKYNFEIAKNKKSYDKEGFEKMLDQIPAFWRQA